MQLSYFCKYFVPLCSTSMEEKLTNPTLFSTPSRLHEVCLRVSALFVFYNSGFELLCACGYPLKP